MVFNRIMIRLVIGAGVVFLIIILILSLNRQEISVGRNDKIVVRPDSNVEIPRDPPEQNPEAMTLTENEVSVIEPTNSLSKAMVVQTSEYASYSSRLKIIRRFSPASTTKLTDLSGKWVISQTKKEAQKIHSLLKKSRANSLVYQNRKLFQTLVDPLIDRNVPVCVVNFRYSTNTETVDEVFLENRVVEIQFPSGAEPKFAAVRLVLESKPGNDVFAKHIDCGYLVDSKTDEAYKQLQFADLWATTGFRLIDLNVN